MGPENPDEVYEELVLPSLLASPLLVEGRSLLDAGTGVGLPGLPLALSAPARRVDLVEPRSGCVGLLHWLIDRLSPLNPRVHEVRLSEVPFHRLPRFQVVTRAALDWSSLRAALPDRAAPILRWSGPSVDPPPSREHWEAHRLRVSWRSTQQEVFWWGPTALFHVKQTRWTEDVPGDWSISPVSPSG